MLVEKKYVYVCMYVMVEFWITRKYSRYIFAGAGSELVSSFRFLIDNPHDDCSGAL